jgi:hypothetical protein
MIFVRFRSVLKRNTDCQSVVNNTYIRTRLSVLHIFDYFCKNKSIQQTNKIDLSLTNHKWNVSQDLLE